MSGTSKTTGMLHSNEFQSTALTQVYSEWYTHPEIAPPLASIPAVNIWDDHDIVDGFGSYKDKWMRAPMFLGIGNKQSLSAFLLR
jgi:hypothetical protein